MNLSLLQENLSTAQALIYQNKEFHFFSVPEKRLK